MKDELGLLSIKEASELLRLSETAILKLRNAGEIPFVNFGSKIYYRKESLIKYVEGQEIKNANSFNTGDSN